MNSNSNDESNIVTYDIFLKELLNNDNKPKYDIEKKKSFVNNCLTDLLNSDMNKFKEKYKDHMSYFLIDVLPHSTICPQKEHYYKTYDKHHCENVTDCQDITHCRKLGKCTNPFHSLNAKNHIDDYYQTKFLNI